jgi:carotenoid 1,2-hydratase
MTERPAGAVRRDAHSLCIGPSAARWEGGVLTLDLAEVGMPIPHRLRGTVRIHPLAMNDRGFVLDAAGRHRWRPIAPRARIEVALDSPSLRWSGHGYFDTNDGDAPLESDFRNWDWCRAAIGDDAAILYNARRRDGTEQTLALRSNHDGRLEDIAVPPPAELARTRWALRRPTRGDAPRVTETLQDAPFYARSVIETGLLGQRLTAVHESLDLDRFALLPVQMMLPFRVPRSLR